MVIYFYKFHICFGHILHPNEAHFKRNFSYKLFSLASEQLGMFYLSRFDYTSTTVQVQEWIDIASVNVLILSLHRQLHSICVRSLTVATLLLVVLLLLACFHVSVYVTLLLL